MRCTSVARAKQAGLQHTLRFDLDVALRRILGILRCTLPPGHPEVVEVVVGRGAIAPRAAGPLLQRLETVSISTLMSVH